MQRLSIAALAIALASCTKTAERQSDVSAPFPDDLPGQVAHIVNDALKSTKVPSFSVAVVEHGKIVLAEAYGLASLEPEKKATAAMKYPIGSVSKQFTAAAILLLADEGMLSLDDDIARYLPFVTRAGEIRIRDLLAHTAGISDYWPHWYVTPAMRRDLEPMQIVKQLGAKPLDFAPGTKWQYSNTGYMAAGLIVEQVAGKPLFDFLRERIFEPLGMHVANCDGVKRLGEDDPTGYVRNALAELRIPESYGGGRGWIFAAGNLAMTAEDLAKWNVALIEHKLLSEAAYRDLTTAGQLPNGVGTQYGLGISVKLEGDRRKLFHPGSLVGFATYNVVYPDDGAAITVIANEADQGSDAAVAIAEQIAPLLFDLNADRARAKTIFSGLQRGKIDPTLFTENGRSYFSDTVLSDYQTSLAPLGAVKRVSQTSESLRGGFISRGLTIECEKGSVGVGELDEPDTDAIEQFYVYPN